MPEFYRSKNECRDDHWPNHYPAPDGIFLGIGQLFSGQWYAGVWINGWCLLGVEARFGGEWSLGFILANRATGIWNPED